MPFWLKILGCGSATPTVYSKPTAQYLHFADRHFLIDCGEGTQVELRRHQLKWSRIDHIFISHLHGDHCYGLPGLISSFHLLERQRELYVYGPPGLERILKLQFRLSNTWLKFPLVFHELNFQNPETILRHQRFWVDSIPLNHSIPACGFVFREAPKERRLLPERLRGHKLPFYALQALKRGENYQDESGKIWHFADYTEEGPNPLSYAFCSDTAFNPQMANYLKDIDLLYHESTFLESERHLAEKTGHSTALDAAKIAQMAQVKRLLLGHYSVRYADKTQFLTEAKTLFEAVETAHDGLDVFVE